MKLFFMRLLYYVLYLFFNGKKKFIRNFTLFLIRNYLSYKLEEGEGRVFQNKLF